MSQQAPTETRPQPRAAAAAGTSAEDRHNALDAQPLTRLQRDGVHYTLIGTAHVSRASADAVRELAGSGQFDAIAVELCQARYDALTAERKWTDLDLFRVLREGKAGLVMANLALSAYQRRIADQFGIEPGAEMRAAAVAAKEHNLPLQLVDRDLATPPATPSDGARYIIAASPTGAWTGHAGTQGARVSRRTAGRFARR